jgi:hypothetical protein
VNWWNRKAEQVDELRATLTSEKATRGVMQAKIHALETEVAELWEIVAVVHAATLTEGENFFDKLRLDLKHGDKLKAKLEDAKHAQGTR